MLAGLLCIITLICTGQTNKEQFSAALKSKDTIAQLALLQKWEKANSNDPELYVCYFNYHVNQGRKEVISLEQGETDEESLQLTDSAGNAAGYMVSRIVYDKDHLDKAIQYIDKGITQFPERLDMRFGKSYLLADAGDYENVVKQITTTLAHSKKNGNKWTWSEGKPLDYPQEFMMSSIQGYVNKIYNTGDDNLLVYMKQIAEAVLKEYPDSVENLSNVSIVYMIQQQPEKALAPLLKAEKLSPADTVVLGNIAQCYKLMGNKTAATNYYNLVIKHGDNESREFAKGQLEQLNKQ